jgi:hypothetical protein
MAREVLQAEIDKILIQCNEYYLRHVELCLKNDAIILEAKKLVERQQDSKARIAVLMKQMLEQEEKPIVAPAVRPHVQAVVERSKGKRQFPGYIR